MIHNSTGRGTKWEQLIKCLNGITIPHHISIVQITLSVDIRKENKISKVNLHTDRFASEVNDLTVRASRYLIVCRSSTNHVTN